jgi:polyisoprenoid-binding protein YceI
MSMRRYFPTIGHPSVRASQKGRTRAILAAAVAASLLLPFSDGAALAAPPQPGNLVRAESPDGLIHLALLPGESEARYIMTVKTLGQAPKNAACSTRAVSGEIVLTPDGAVIPELSQISLDQRTLKCQAPLRDNMAQQLLQTAQHPMAVFTVQSAPGLGAPLPAGDAAFQLVGDQTVRGLTRPTTYDTNANLTPDAMVGQARTTFKMTTFGITPPSIGPLIQVSDDMVAEVDIKAAIGAPAAGTSLPAVGEPAAGEGAAPAAETP